MPSTMCVLHMEKFLSITYVTHEKMFSRLDALHMYNPIMSIELVARKLYYSH